MSDLSPRQWGKGDPEPPSLVQLRDQRGDRLIHDQGKWVFVECDGEPPEVYDSGASWAELDKLYDIEWPLTEVLPHLHWPYPDEPGQECFCAIGADHGPPPSRSSQDAPEPVSVVSGGQGSGETPATDELRAIPYAEHEQAMREEIERRDEAEEWADKLAAALAPPHVVGEHSLKNHPWRNALEWSQRPLPADETEWEYGLRYPSGLLFEPYKSREAAEDSVRPGATVVRRRVSPWEQVEQS